MKSLRLFFVLFVFSCFICMSHAQTIKFDPDKTAEPISPYIYGQFIEHLGNCIYGGIWAEMLDDRKFCFPVTDEFKPTTTLTDANWGAGPYKIPTGSPWKVLGQPGMTKMEKEGAFVGEHSVAIIIPGSGAEQGISQEGLAVVKDKKYVGRIVLAGEGEVAPIVVQLAFPDGKLVTRSIESVTDEFKTYPLEFVAPASSDNVRFEIVSNANGLLRIGAVSLMPADNIDGLRPDVLALLKELNSPIYRWPGGNFVSGYDWRHGLGADRDKRAPQRNPAWAGIESNDFGIHEFMDLMQKLGAEPFIALNMGLGSVEDAVKEVEYLIGSPDSPMGKLRTQNGRAEPWKVNYWAVGNEMYGNWQRGFMPQNQYIAKQNQAAEQIWKIDPKAQLIAVGNVGPWTENMFKGSANFMSLLSEHIYCKLIPDPVAHAQQLKNEIKRVSDAHRKYRTDIEQIKGKNIRLAMDEWNYWYGDYIFGDLGCRYRHKDGLGVAMGLHEFFRNSDLYFMANYAQTVNVLGCIKASKTAASLETTGLMLAMYRKHFGTIPIPIIEGPADLDVSIAWTSDKKAITVAAVNLSKEPRTITLNAMGKLKPGAAAKRWTIAHADMEAFNDPGKPMAVKIDEESPTITDHGIPIAPQAAVIYQIDVSR